MKTFLTLFLTFSFSTTFGQSIDSLSVLGESTITRICTGLYSKPSPVSEKITVPNYDQKVQILDYYKKPYLAISIGEMRGFVSSICVKENSVVTDLIYADDANLRRLIKKYGDVTIAKRISRGTVWIGMTRVMLMDSKGSPDDKNITKTVYGTSEQWVYRKRGYNADYVYLDDVVVTAIQESK